MFDNAKANLQEFGIIAIRKLTGHPKLYKTIDFLLFESNTHLVIFRDQLKHKCLWGGPSLKFVFK